MANNVNSAVSRTKIIPFINLAPADSETPQYEKCGYGWKAFSENPNAQTESTKYINMESETTDTTSYSPQYSFECDLMSSEPTIKEIYSIAKERKTYGDCVREFVIVDAFNKVDSAANAYVAWKENLAVAVTSIDGDKKMSISGNLNGQGDTVKGKAVLDAKNEKIISFTPDTEENAQPVALSETDSMSTDKSKL